MRKLYILVLLAMFCLFSCKKEPDEPLPSVPANVTIPEDFLGMVHAGNRYNTDEYQILDEMNAIWLLNDCSWGTVQPTPTTWNFGDADPSNPTGYYKFCKTAFEKGKKVYAMMGYDASWIHTEVPDPNYVPGSPRRYVSRAQTPLYVAYVKESIRHLYQYVGAWGIWNEPDIRPRFWTGTDADYYYMVCETIKGIRAVEAELKAADKLAANETIKIIIGAYSPQATPAFIKGLLDNPETRMADGIAYHPYGINSVGSSNYYDDFKKLVEPYGFGNKIWLNELGYPTGGLYHTKVPDPMMPTEVTKTLTAMAVRGAKAALWYQYKDGSVQDPNDSEDWFGLLNNDYSPKTGAPAFALWGQHIPGSVYKPGFPKASKIPGGVQYHYFKGKGDEHCLIIWTDKPTPRDLTIKLPGTARKCYDTNISLWQWPTTPLTNNEFPSAAVTDVEESATYSISGNAKFFIWTNPNLDQPPEISGN